MLISSNLITIKTSPVIVPQHTGAKQINQEIPSISWLTMAFSRSLARPFIHEAKSLASCIRPLRQAVRQSDSETNAISHRFLLKDLNRMQLLNRYPARLDCLATPEVRKEELSLSMKEVRKVLKAAQIETVRTKLKLMDKDRIFFKDYMKICGESWGLDEGISVAKALDEAGDVIVLADVVFLRPDQVAKAVQCAMPISVSGKQEDYTIELRELEEKKAAIDKLAERGVRKELCCGLGFLIVQTVGLMRLTFWELSWDVMEPICFYLTSTYFLAGYGFFLRTSTEPSFESFFKSRFHTKQKQLMKAHGFDLSRFNQLKAGGFSTV